MKPLPRLRCTTFVCLAAFVQLTAAAGQAAPPPAVNARTSKGVEPAKPPALKPPPAPGPVAEALTALAQELKSNTPASMPLQQRMDALTSFVPSPATAAKLARIYGPVSPWSWRRKSSTASGTEYSGALAPLHFKDSDGSTVDWDAIQIGVGVRADSNAMQFIGGVRNLSSSDDKMHISARDLSFEGRHERSADNLWFGGSWFNLATLSFEPRNKGPRMVFEDVRGDQRVVDHKNVIELAQQLSVRRIAIGDDGVDNIKLQFRITGLDRQTMLALQDADAKPLPTTATASPQERQAQLLPLMKVFSKGAIRSGTALDIDDLTATFHGQTLRATGRVSLEGATDEDAEQLPLLLKKLVLRLNIKAPLALVREVANVMATMQLKAKAPNGKPDPQAVIQLASSMNDIFIGKMVSGGFVRIDNDTLVSDIEFKGSTGLRVNGKPVALPTPAAATAGLPPVASASPMMLQARRIDARCTLPAYPAEVVKADSPLQLSMRLIVKADGTVRNVTLTKPSGRPDYDQAVLAAAARCVYLPALRNGQPVDAPVLWNVVREPGSSHP